MKILSYLLLTIVLIHGLQAQTDSIPQSKQNAELFNQEWHSKFSLGAGLFIPQGRLNDFIGISPLVDLELNIQTPRNQSIDIVLQFVIPNQTEDFLIQTTLNTIEAQSTFLANYFLRFNKNVLPVSSTHRLEIGFGLGASTIVTDVRNPFFEGEDDQEEYESITTILLMPGLKWIFKPGKETLLTLGLDLHYAPYRIEGALEENIGGLAISPRLTYRF